MTPQLPYVPANVLPRRVPTGTPGQFVVDPEKARAGASFGLPDEPIRSYRDGCGKCHADDLVRDKRGDSSCHP